MKLVICVLMLPISLPPSPSLSLQVTQPSQGHTPSSDSLRLSPAVLPSPTAQPQHVQLPKRKGLNGMRVESPAVEKVRTYMYVKLMFTLKNLHFACWGNSPVSI